MADWTTILRDLDAEHRSLDDLVSDLDAEALDRQTPADGWSIRDQISHLAFFDERATEAASEPDKFAAGLTAAMADPDAFMVTALGRDRSEHPLMWWRRVRESMLQAFESLDTSDRIPWYGPAMGAASFATARLMETWAHGQDVADALGVRREPTDRLRHIAHLGVRTRGFSFTNRAMAVPGEDVRVELTGPGGDIWTWGDERAADRVHGSAEDFCLVVTQRRHLDDVELVAEGDVATRWMAVAQAFAGPPGPGRDPGRNYALKEL